MSESPVENVPEVEPVVESEVIPEPTNEMFPQVKGMANDIATKANAIVDEIKASRVDVGKAIFEIREDTTNTDRPEWLKTGQEWLEKAAQNIENRVKELNERIAKELVKASEMTDDDYKLKVEEYKGYVKSHKLALNMVVNIPGYDARYYNDALPLKTLAGGTSGATTGTLRKRVAHMTINGKPVFVVKTDKKDGTKSESYSFTVGAAFIADDSKVKVLPSDLSSACFAAAGTSEISTLNEVKYAFTPVGSDKTYMVVVIPAKGK